MTDSEALTRLLTPVISQYKPHSILTAGDTAAMCLPKTHHTKLQHLNTPFSLEQLQSTEAVDLAIISHLTESMEKVTAQQWLGMIKNRLSPRVILISHRSITQANGWHLTDYLAMGFRHFAGSEDGLQLFSYAIENYQLERDWLNSRYWANPEMYDKYYW